MPAEEAQFSSAITEAANRAEVTALLIRCGYRVYRPEADVYGEDLVVLPPSGQLHAVQLKARPTVNLAKYGNRNLWMLFPSFQHSQTIARDWFLVPHDFFFEWVKKRHGHAPKWNDVWHYPSLSKNLQIFLEPYKLIAFPESERFTTGFGEIAVTLPDGPDTPELREARRTLVDLEMRGVILRPREKK